MRISRDREQPDRAIVNAGIGMIDVNYFGRLATIILTGDRQVVLGHGS